MKDLYPAGPAVRETLRALDEAPLPPEEFMRRVQLPLTGAEIDDARELIAWFSRRYPTGRERLAYVRRAWRRWNRRS